MSRVQDFINQGLRPHMGPGNTLQLRAGRRFARLSDMSGKLMAAGNEWEARTAEQLPESGIHGAESNSKWQHKDDRVTQWNVWHHTQIECGAQSQGFHEAGARLLQEAAAWTRFQRMG